jgi:hypothetical protein
MNGLRNMAAFFKKGRLSLRGGRASISLMSLPRRVYCRNAQIAASTYTAGVFAPSTIDFAGRTADALGTG